MASAIKPTARRIQEAKAPTGSAMKKGKAESGKGVSVKKTNKKK